MKRLHLTLLILSVAGFSLGLARLFQLRFEAGDVYPEYSSLRADPLGAKALYESLDKLLPVRRHYQPLPRLGDGSQTTLLYLGVDAEELRFPMQEWRDLESFISSGGRLVISLLPSYQNAPINRFLGTNAPPPGGKGRRSPTKRDDELGRLRPIPIEERWGVQFEHAELARDENKKYQPAPAFRRDAFGVPESILCRTALFFNRLDDNWRVIYARTNDRAILIERRFGRGSIVLAAESYYLSNEALLQEREPELLAWLIGPGQRVVFEETHLGVQETAGIAALGRKYRLHGLLGGLLLLAGLFVWKSAASFIPPHEVEAQREGSDLVAGRESAAGFINLLRRNIPSRDLLAACIVEWKKSCSHQVPRARLERVQSIIDAENSLPPKERDPIRTYQAISRALMEGNPLRKT